MLTKNDNDTSLDRLLFYLIFKVDNILPFKIKTLQKKEKLL